MESCFQLRNQMPVHNSVVIFLAQSLWVCFMRFTENLRKTAVLCIATNSRQTRDSKKHKSYEVYCCLVSHTTANIGAGGTEARKQRKSIFQFMERSYVRGVWGHDSLTLCCTSSSDWPLISNGSSYEQWGRLDGGTNSVRKKQCTYGDMESAQDQGKWDDANWPSGGNGALVDELITKKEIKSSMEMRWAVKVQRSCADSLWWGSAKRAVVGSQRVGESCCTALPCVS